jgi:hypothetical protein
MADLSAHSGDAGDLPAAVLQRSLDAVADGPVTVPVTVPIAGVDAFDDIAQAHRDREAGGLAGTRVVPTD